MIPARKGSKINVHVTQNAQKPTIYLCFRELLTDLSGH